jgi:hypothetical protein
MRTASRGAITLAVLVVLALMVVPTTAFGSGQPQGQGQGQGSESSNAGGNGKGNSAKVGGIPGSDKDGDADHDSSTTYTEDGFGDTQADNDGAVHEDGDYESLHPSGNDKRTESGGSGNQGNSESDPDDNVGPKRFECSEDGPTDPRGGCTDKAQGAGGWYDTDQDGNNGCGNDQDFDDDNNGKCGDPGPPPPPPTPPEHNTGGGGDVTLPNVIFRHPQPDTIVRGKQIVSHPRPPLQAQLPLTGTALAPLLVLGLGLVTGGAALSTVRPRRNRRDLS